VLAAIRSPAILAETNLDELIVPSRISEATTVPSAILLEFIVDIGIFFYLC